MKKIRNISGLLIFIGLFFSCNDWLNQTPFDKVPGDQLYATESGAQEALNGLYLGLLNRSVYGGELTAGLTEVLAEHYYIPNGHAYKDLVDFKYTTDASQSYFLSIWKKLYKLIAECNVFLAQIEANKANYNVENYKLYRGEAMALRTFLHFDLFRLFGPAYTEENKLKDAIPYYDRETDMPTAYKTVEEIMAQLLIDINESISLLVHDPLLNSGKLAFQGETFWDFRSIRFNIYAAWALKARMCLYIGDNIAAHTIATSLLEGRNPEGGNNNFNTVFPSILTINSNYRDPVFFSEIIFGMHDIDRESLYKKYFSLDLKSETILLAGEKWRTAMFSSNITDLRYKYFGDATEKSETEALLSILKYKQSSITASDPYPYRYELIPLIRKGELYLIAAETSTNDIDKAYWLEKLILTRGGYQLGDVAGDLDAFLELEYDRELYGEGQYFYFLKRKGKTIIKKQDGNTKNVNANYFVFPIPDEEKDNRTK